MSFGENIDDLVENSTNGLHAIHPTWERVKVGDVATLVNGFAFKSAGFNEAGGTPIVRIRDVTKGVPSTFYRGPVDDSRMTWLENGQIVIGMDGDFNCRVWNGGKALLNQRVCTLSANESLYSQRFLAFALPAYLKLINTHTSSITVKHLSSQTVRDIPLPLPPLNEQRRIVEKIETLFAKLDKGEEAIRAVQTLLARYRQSVLKAAVTGELTGNDPATWQSATLGDLLEDIRYGTAKKCRPDVEGVAVLRIPNVANGEIDLQDLKYAQLDDREVRTLSLRKGDLLIVRSNGSAKLVGRGAVVNNDAVGLAFAGYLIRLRVDRRRLLPDFLQLALSSPVVRARIERQARSTSGVHNINSGEVKAIAFDLPPVDVQAKIIELVEEHMAKTGDMEAWCQTELTRSAALRQSILKDAFAGRLVPQDPADEPASALLARTKKARGAKMPVPRRRVG